MHCYQRNHCRTRLQPIRTVAEITAHIKILPARQPYLYQKLSPKATPLRLLGMSPREIPKAQTPTKKLPPKLVNMKGVNLVPFIIQTHLSHIFPENPASFALLFQSLLQESYQFSL
jgi:hypothetical protein